MGYFQHNVRFQQDKYENKCPKQNKMLFVGNEAWEAYFLRESMKYKISQSYLNLST